jgi:hypothetical protein
MNFDHRVGAMHVHTPRRLIGRCEIDSGWLADAVPTMGLESTPRLFQVTGVWPRGAR